MSYNKIYYIKNKIGRNYRNRKKIIIYYIILNPFLICSKETLKKLRNRTKMAIKKKIPITALINIIYHRRKENLICYLGTLIS
jgi:hypothetical protein